MGLRNRIKRLADRLSGEYSSAAPDEGPTPYQREGNPVGGEVVKARLKRPRDQDKSNSGDDSKED